MTRPSDALVAAIHAVQAERTRLERSGGGHVVIGSTTGPICLAPIDAMMTVLAELENRVAKLESEVAILRAGK